MTTTDVQDILQLLIENNVYDEDEGGDFKTVETYDEAGIMTSDKGLVVTAPDGSQFQITIVKSRNGY